MSRIDLCQFGSVRSFVSNRKAHCKNCWTFEEGGNAILPGEKRITVAWGMGINARTLYLCSDCAIDQAERMEQLAYTLRRAVGGFIDTNQEWLAERSDYLASEGRSA